MVSDGPACSTDSAYSTLLDKNGTTGKAAHFGTQWRKVAVIFVVVASGLGMILCSSRTSSFLAQPPSNVVTSEAVPRMEIHLDDRDMPAWMVEIPGDKLVPNDELEQVIPSHDLWHHMPAKNHPLVKGNNISLFIKHNSHEVYGKLANMTLQFGFCCTDPCSGVADCAVKQGEGLISQRQMFYFSGGCSGRCHW